MHMKFRDALHFDLIQINRNLVKEINRKRADTKKGLELMQKLSLKVSNQSGSSPSNQGSLMTSGKIN